MDDKEFKQRYVEKFLKVNNQLSEIQQKPLKLENGTIVSTSQLHFIDAVGRYPNINVTGLSEVLGLTKGAISQQFPRMIRDNYVIKSSTLENKKEIYFSLTEKGNEIFLYHESLHKDLYEDIMKALEDMPESSMKVVESVMDKVSNSIIEYQEKMKIN